jgi:hypothetical protein
MTELSLVWKKIFDEISIADDHITGKINYYNLASILEDLYVENAELKARVEALENDKKQWTHPESGVVSNDINLDGCYDEMFEEAARREAAMKAVEKLYEENGDALKRLAEIEKEELINEALEELNAIVLGGQNTREFYLSVSHIRNVLERLK